MKSCVHNTENNESTPRRLRPFPAGLACWKEMENNNLLKPQFQETLQKSIL